MAKSKVVQKLIPEEEREMTEQRTSFDKAEEYAELHFDQDFWLKVDVCVYYAENPSCQKGK